MASQGDSCRDEHFLALCKAGLQITHLSASLQNELAILEFIHCLVETLDRYFSNVCELDLMFNLEMVRLPLQMNINVLQMRFSFQSRQSHCMAVCSGCHGAPVNPQVLGGGTANLPRKV